MKPMLIIKRDGAGVSDEQVAANEELQRRLKPILDTFAAERNDLVQIEIRVEWQRAMMRDV